MTSSPIITHILRLRPRPEPVVSRNRCVLAPNEAHLPAFVRQSPPALRFLRLLSPLDWQNFPERDLSAGWPNLPVPYAALAAACLIKLEQGLPTLSALRRYLLDNPALVWLCGFPLTPSRRYSWGFDADASLPTARHLTRLLHTVPNATFQFLLDSSVTLIQQTLAAHDIRLGERISLDTKHILAWVKENNPKTYLPAGRFDKQCQPKGDPDCRLGCKRRHNQAASSSDHSATPHCEGLPASQRVSLGEFYWGYASGVVACKVAAQGEFVLAELTQPFDQPDVAYFFPLMAQVERRLGYRPRCAALDAAFDAWYVYAYFYNEDDPQAFAAIPFADKGGYSALSRHFSPDGLPLCPAALPMPLVFTFTDRSSTLVVHERGRYGCPLRYPQPSGEVCPVQHKNWAKKGCTTTLPTSIGARLRYQLDRHSEAYQEVYRQRTATERINSQAVELGIERPKLRNGLAIANLNTLTYVLINLRAWHRLSKPQAA